MPVKLRPQVTGGILSLYWFAVDGNDKLVGVYNGNGFIGVTDAHIITTHAQKPRTETYQFMKSLGTLDTHDSGYETATIASLFPIVLNSMRNVISLSLLQLGVVNSITE